MKNHILYLAHSKRIILQECLFSIYSLINLYGEGINSFNINIYTDDVPYLKKRLPNHIRFF